MVGVCGRVWVSILNNNFTPKKIKDLHQMDGLLEVIHTITTYAEVIHTIATIIPQYNN